MQLPRGMRSFFTYGSVGAFVAGWAAAVTPEYQNGWLAAALWLLAAWFGWKAWREHEAEQPSDEPFSGRFFPEPKSGPDSQLAEDVTIGPLMPGHLLVTNVNQTDALQKVEVLVTGIKPQVDGVFKDTIDWFQMRPHPLEMWIPDTGHLFPCESRRYILWRTSIADDRELFFAGQKIEHACAWEVVCEVRWSGPTTPVVKTFRFSWEPGTPGRFIE